MRAGNRGMFPTETYRGPNRSHRKFYENYGYLNALYYLVVSCRERLQAKLNEDLQKPGVAVGVVTHPVSRTQFQAVVVHKDDARRMANDFGGFMLTFQQQTIVSAYRVLITYLAEFLLEAHEARLIDLPEKDVRRLREGFLSPKKLGEIYKGVGIPITATDDEAARFKALVATRNVIEHNDGLVNEEYLRLTSGADLSVGDNAPTSSKEVGEALAIAEWLSNSVNQRGLSRWPTLASCTPA